MINSFAPAVMIGIGATLILDLWSILLNRVFGIATLNVSLIGRWVGSMARGRFIHRPITATAPVAGEQAIGWAVHFAIGVFFAAIFVALSGPQWLGHPTVAPALLFGIVTVVAPFFVMQPAMGAGFAASRLPEPQLARLKSLSSHAVFGVGLYLSALGLAALSAR